MRNRIRRILGNSRRWASSRAQPRAAVLMYHGIGDADIDPWGLFVSAANFEQHLQVLADTGAAVGLDDLGAACEAGTLKRGTTALTFDDGYANNLSVAKPLLEAHEVPATVFVIGDQSGGQREFWWDELAAVILQPGELPPTLALPGPGMGFEQRFEQRFELGPACRYSASQWRDDHRYRDGEAPAGPRMQLYRDLWSHLLKLDPGHRREALDAVADWAGGPSAPRASHRGVTMDELIDLDGGPVSVGGHTMTHPLLPEIPVDRVDAEITDNKIHLESVLGRPVHNFSYPFGANDERAVDAVAQAGYRLAVTTRPESVTASVDRRRVGRFDVKNWSGEEFERRLRRWLRYR